MNKKFVLPFLLSSTVILATGCNDDSDKDNKVITQPAITPSSSLTGLASEDQINAEKQALEFINTPESQAALKLKAADLLQIAKSNGTEIDDYNRTLLDQAIQETTFASALSLYNNDKSNEKIISILAAAHTWFGVNALGSRTVFDNPDTTYRTIPIDTNVSYVIKGTANSKLPLDVNFSLWDKNNQTLSNLATSDLVRNKDGSFEIYVSKQSAPSTYANYIQLKDTATSIFIRNTINDWKNQQFDKLSIERADGSKRIPIITKDDRYKSFLSNLTSAGPAYNYYYKLSNAPSVNTLPELTLGGTEGRLSTQAATYSPFHIEDDEALIFTTTLGDANYFILPVYNQWFTTTNYIDKTQTLNNAQSLANADGSYTYVISKKDPGIYNWIDTDGLNRGYLNPRWQGLSGNPNQALPTASLKLVKLVDLKNELPSGIKLVNETERKTQLELRKKSYELRYTP